jgi:hypothetical protein
MKGIILLILSFLLICSCKKENVEKSLLDFQSANYLLPSQILQCKTEVPCSETPYWEGKKIKMQGFAFQGDVDSKERHFALYESNDIRTPNVIRLDFAASDSLAIVTKFLENKDKHCVLKATCLTSEPIPLKNCVKLVVFTLIKADDLEFK